MTSTASSSYVLPTASSVSPEPAPLERGRPGRRAVLLGMAGAAGLALAAAPPAAAQTRIQGGAQSHQAIARRTISFARIASPDTEVHPLGNRPAMHDGLVAFYGYRGASYGTDAVVALTQDDGLGNYTILAAEGEPRPDVPGSQFDHFANPSIFAGEVVFLGGEFGTLSSTYVASTALPYQLFDDAGIPNPFFGSLGVTTPASPQGISYRDSFGNVHFLGLHQDPLPCASGIFGFQNVSGLTHVPQGGDRLVWPARVITSDFQGNIVAGYDALADQLYCVADGFDLIPGLGVPFDFYFKADTDGDKAVFIGMDPTIGFDRHEGVYVRDISGLGAITLIADTLTAAPGGGAFGGFEQVSIDGNLVIFEGCAGGLGGCAVYGFFGCFLENGVPGPVFEILNTSNTIDGRQIIDVTMSPTGRDGHAFAFDVRHSANSASLYVATITN